MSNSDEPRVTFAHEIEVRQSDKHIDNAVRLSRGVIEVSVEPPTNWDALSYQEPIASDVEPILFPWGGVRSQTWRWDGSHFTKAKEVAQREQLPGGGTRRPSRRPHPAEPPTPKVARGGSLSESMLDQYRRGPRRRGRRRRPKSDLRVQVTGDARPERVVLVGRDIVVFGPGFKGGAGYSFVTLAQFADAADMTEMSARDLTGDGDADLIVRGVRHVSADGGRSTPRCCSSTRCRATRSRASSASRRRASGRASACRGWCSSSPRRATRRSTSSPRPGARRAGPRRRTRGRRTRPAAGRHRAAAPAVGRHRQRALPLERLAVRQAGRLTGPQRRAAEPPSRQERRGPRRERAPEPRRGSRPGDRTLAALTGHRATPGALRSLDFLGPLSRLAALRLGGSPLAIDDRAR